MPQPFPGLSSIDEAFGLAVTHHQAGRLAEAEQLYRAILDSRANHADANHNLGVLACQVGQPLSGLAFLKTAWLDNQCHDLYTQSYIEALLVSAQFLEAEETIQTALQGGLKTSVAQSLQSKLVAMRTDNSMKKQSLVASKEGTANDNKPATEISASEPSLPHTERKRIASLFNSGRHAELEELTRALLRRYPESGFVWQALGVSLSKQGKEALPVLRQAATLLPEDAQVHNSLGIALQKHGALYEAVASYRRALKINPGLSDTHSNLGSALRKLGKLEEAVESLRQAISNDPLNALAHNNLGNILKDLGQLDAAAASYDRALQIKPDFVMVYSNLLFIRNYLSDQPAAQLLLEAQRFGQLVSRMARPYSNWGNTPDPFRRLRVGLVSGDFRNHPVGYFVENIAKALAANAIDQIELVAYSTQLRSDVLTERIKKCCQGWYAVVGLSDEALAKKVHDDGVDILIDLSGHTALNRLPMFAWKPAPVQVSWLGYFATTGVPTIDYLIADPWTLPESEEAYFTEKIWRLPETRLCFSQPDIDTQVVELPAIGSGRITFGCFNNLTKMNDQVVPLWARVLKAVPDSCLLLKSKQLDEAAVRQRVVERFSAQGVEPSRLVLEGFAPRAEYMATYGKVDISLDTFPYPGGTTTAESLWMGVPVLTLAGTQFLSRQGSGLLENAGLSDWIAVDVEDFVARAVSHASNLPQLAALRSILRQQVLMTPIFDADRFSRYFVTALREMWQEWCSKQESAPSRDQSSS